jgi:hypothetical protein
MSMPDIFVKSMLVCVRKSSGACNTAQVSIVQHDDIIIVLSVEEMLLLRTMKAGVPP